MFDLKALFYQTVAALGVAFAGTWATLASLASTLEVDIAAGKQIVFAAIAAAIGGVAGFVGNLLRQRWLHTHQVVGTAAEALLAQAAEKIAAARRGLAG